MTSFLIIMGVNKLFEYLKARKLVKVYQVNNEKCDALFIDGTNIFCMFSKHSPNGESSYIEVKRLINRFIPRQYVYISMDGKSPEQKISNQFQKNIHVQQINNDENLKKIEKYNEQSYNIFGNEIGRDVFYNGRTNEGEGEQKIIQYIRKNSQSNQKYYIISNDNDLIFLLLQFINIDISILKIFIDEKTKNIKYYIINIAQVREYFLNKIHQNMNPNITNVDIEKLIRDIIGISFFLGNDYVKCFDEIEKCYNVFDIILDAYGEINSKSQYSYRFLTNGNSFINENLQLFILHLSSKLKIKYEQRCKQRQMHKQSKQKSKTKIEFNSIQKAQAKDMVKALNWTLSYYLGEIPSWNYHYNDKILINLNDFGLLISTK